MTSYSRTQAALRLGPLVAVVPLSIDIYLPAMPAMGRAMNASPGEVQLTLVAFMFALAAGPLLLGPISDRIGRRPVLLSSLILFIASSAAAAFATSIEMLILLRVLQGLGGAGAQVCARASVRDLFSGHQAAQLLSVMMLIHGLAPILAPLLGSMIIAFLPWNSIFLLLAACGVLALGLVRYGLRETLPADKRNTSGSLIPLRSFADLFSDRRFMRVVLVGAFIHAGFLCYLTSSPHVFMLSYGISATEFSLLFALNGFAILIGTQLNVRLLPRFGPARIVRAAVIVNASAAGLLLAAVLLGFDSLAIFGTVLFVCVGCLGFINNNTMALGLEHQPHRAGMAAAVISSLQILLGALAGLAVSLFGSGSPSALALAIFTCVVLALIFSKGIVEKRQ